MVRVSYEVPPPWPQPTSSTCLPLRSTWVAVRRYYWMQNRLTRPTPPVAVPSADPPRSRS
jgi:hypothetical protein